MKEISQAKAHFVTDLLGSWEILRAYPPKKTNLEPFDKESSLKSSKKSDVDLKDADPDPMIGS